MNFRKLRVGVDPQQLVVPEEVPRVIHVNELPWLRRVLSVTQHWCVWISTVLAGRFTTMNDLFDVRIETWPPNVAARKLFATRAAWIRLV